MTTSVLNVAEPLTSVLLVGRYDLKTHGELPREPITPWEDSRWRICVATASAEVVKLMLINRKSCRMKLSASLSNLTQPYMTYQRDICIVK